MLTQELRILNAALSMAEEANGTQRPLRHVRPGVVDTIVKRSLAITASLPPSLREHLAIRDLSDFISMSQSNKSAVLSPRNTDLLPIGHPRSSRSHALSLDSIYAHRSRWEASDCSIGSDEARALVAAAFSAVPNSLEHRYLSARLRALPAGVIPPSVLLASTYSGKNSRAARSARARAQKRDRKGRFVWMGGGVSASVERENGVRTRLTGRLVSQGTDENGIDFFDMEGRDGQIRRVEARASEGTKGYLESADASPEGFSPTPANSSAGEYFMKESDIRIVEAPNGFYRDANYTGPGIRYTDDAYEIIKLNGDEIYDNFDMVPDYLTRRDAQGRTLLRDGKPVYISRRVGDSSTDNGYQSWADVQEWINKDQNNRDKSEGREPDVLARLTPEQYDDLVENVGDGDPVEYARRQLGLEKGTGTGTGEEGDGTGKKEEEAPRFDYILPENAYNIDLYEPFVPRDNIDAVSSDYTEDPNELAAMFDEDELRGALETAILSDGDGPASGMSPMEFPDGEVDSVPAEAIFDAMRIQGLDAEAEVADIYDSQMDGTPNRDALNAFNDKYSGSEGEAKARLEGRPALSNADRRVHVLAKALGIRSPEVQSYLTERYGARLLSPSASIPQDIYDTFLDDHEGLKGDDLKAAIAEWRANPSGADKESEATLQRPLPALLEGLSDEEKAQFQKDGKYEQYLPKNFEWAIDLQGRHMLDPAPFDREGSASGIDPLVIAEQQNSDRLKDALRTAISNEGALPGAAGIFLEDADGDIAIISAPAEAIRDALQLKGIDTNSLIDEIYNDLLDNSSGDDQDDEAALNRDLTVTPEHRAWLLDADNRVIEKMHPIDLLALRQVITGMTENVYDNTPGWAALMYQGDLIDLIDRNTRAGLLDSNNDRGRDAQWFSEEDLRRGDELWGVPPGVGNNNGGGPPPPPPPPGGGGGGGANNHQDELELERRKRAQARPLQPGDTALDNTPVIPILSEWRKATQDRARRFAGRSNIVLKKFAAGWSARGNKRVRPTHEIVSRTADSSLDGLDDRGDLGLDLDTNYRDDNGNIIRVGDIVAHRRGGELQNPDVETVNYLVGKVIERHPYSRRDSNGRIVWRAGGLEVEIIDAENRDYIGKTFEYIATFSEIVEQPDLKQDALDNASPESKYSATLWDMNDAQLFTEYGNVLRNGDSEKVARVSTELLARNTFDPTHMSWLLTDLTDNALSTLDLNMGPDEGASGEVMRRLLAFEWTRRSANKNARTFALPASIFDSLDLVPDNSTPALRDFQRRQQAPSGNLEDPPEEINIPVNLTPDTKKTFLEFAAEGPSFRLAGRIYTPETIKSLIELRDAGLVELGVGDNGAVDLFNSSTLFTQKGKDFAAANGIDVSQWDTASPPPSSSSDPLILPDDESDLFKRFAQQLTDWGWVNSSNLRTEEIENFDRLEARGFVIVERNDDGTINTDGGRVRFTQIGKNYAEQQGIDVSEWDDSGFMSATEGSQMPEVDERNIFERFVSFFTPKTRPPSVAGDPATRGIEHPSFGTIDADAVDPNAVQADYTRLGWEDQRAAEIAEAARSRPALSAIQQIAIEKYRIKEQIDLLDLDLNDLQDLDTDEMSEEDSDLITDKISDIESQLMDLNSEFTTLRADLSSMIQAAWGLDDVVAGEGLRFIDVRADATVYERNGNFSSVRIDISAKPTDGNGNVLGRISRYLDLDMTGSRPTYVHNAYFTLDQGPAGVNPPTGGSDAYNRWMENWYIANGVDYVDVEAAGGGSWTGAARWALNNFFWQEPDTEIPDRIQMLRRAFSNMPDASPADKRQRARVERDIVRLENLVDSGEQPSPLQFIMVGWRPGMIRNWFGFEVMKSRGWNGQKDLTPDSVSSIEAQQYAEMYQVARERIRSAKNAFEYNAYLERVLGSEDSYASENLEEIAPFRDEFIPFFSDNENGERSLAELSPPARESLHKWATDSLMNPSVGDGLDTEVAMRLVLQLNDEAVAYDKTPLQAGLDDAVFSKMTTQDIEAAFASGDYLSIDGEETRYRVTDQLTEWDRGGVNPHYIIKNEDTGQRLWVKWSSGWHSDATAKEMATNMLQRMLNLRGASYMASDANGVMVVATQAGSGIRGATPAKDMEYLSVPTDQLSMADTAGISVIDAVIGGFDRHSGNWMFVDRGFGAFPRYVPLAVDHGGARLMDYIRDNETDVEFAADEDSIDGNLGEAHYALEAMLGQEKAMQIMAETARRAVERIENSGIYDMNDATVKIILERLKSISNW